MRRVGAVLLLVAALCFAQKPKASPDEDEELQRALAEAGSSSVEFGRALEEHLAKFPASPHKAEIERALVKAAVDNKDDKRLILYGERVLARDPDDLGTLERVSQALLAAGGKEEAERALKYSHHYGELVRAMEQDKPPEGREAAQWREEFDRRVGRALALEAQAAGTLGKNDDAISLARKSFETFPTPDAARVAAKWLSAAGKDMEAAAFYADAFVLPDPHYTEAMRARDRTVMGQLYRKAKGSETGLGDIVLEAYDRTSGMLAERRLKLRQLDPNLQATSPMEFTLSGVKGDKLSLASLKGKVLVLDFWATWCGPCRAQHPLYEEVKKNFKDDSQVVFLSIDTDEEHDLVAPFLESNKWEKNVYFEDGMAVALSIRSIPTTIIIDPRGEVFSRMNGFIPERFVEMLTGRIQAALKKK